MKEPLRERMGALIWVTSFLSSRLLLFGPLRLYYTNVLEFPFTGTEVLPYLVFFFLLGVAVLTVIGLLLGNWLYRKYLAALLSLACLLWVQGNLFIWGSGTLSGREIRWESCEIQCVIDRVLWVLVFASAMLCTSFWHKIARTLSAAFLLIQLISVLFYFIQ
ncbi:MAG: hypothetical protein NT045_06115, partial [Candidatus Aureabacteria bacterium]|nr:hypothetical protein [Candidatus Auribacterota bacterium]